MLNLLPFTASFLTGATLLVGLALGGWFTFLTPLVVFVVLPVLDTLVGHDTAETLEPGANGAPFDWIVRAWAPAQLLLLGAALAWVSLGDPTPIELVGVLISTSLVTAGGAINAAHELMHRVRPLDRALAELLMTTATYTHFNIEHVHGHHKHVATPLDPATARRGESVYAFLPRTLVGGLRSAWRLERERNARRDVPWLTWRNRLTRYAVEVALAYAVVAAAFGAVGVAFFAAQSLGAVLLLEVINYVEHYGLQRDQLPDGRYEPVAPRHSWNANHRISNWWLFNLQRHADHHATASRPYYHLVALEDGPQLPFSYPTAILVALIPPLWWAMVDPGPASGFESSGAPSLPSGATRR